MLVADEEFFYEVGSTRKKKLFSVDKKNQLDVTFCILYFSYSNC